MIRFTYGLTSGKGYAFDPSPGETESEIRALILGWAGYKALPLEAPFVGHSPIGRDQYVVLAKPAGERAYAGWLMTRRQYAADYDLSPYRLLAEEAPRMGIASENVAPLPPPEGLLLTTAPAEHLAMSARFYAGFDQERRMRPHRSIMVGGEAGEASDALFVSGEVAAPAAEAHRLPNTPPPAAVAEMREELGKLRDAISSLQTDPTALALKIADLTRRLERSEEAQRREKSAAEHKADAQRRQDQEISQADSQFFGTAAAPDALKAQVTSLQMEIATLQEKTRHASSKLSKRLFWGGGVAALLVAGGMAWFFEEAQTRARELRQVSADLENLRVVHGVNQTDLRNALSVAETQWAANIQSVHERLIELNGEYATLDMRINHAESEINATTNQYAAFLERISGLEGEAEGSKGELVRLGASMDEATSRETSLTARIASLESRTQWIVDIRQSDYCETSLRAPLTSGRARPPSEGQPQNGGENRWSALQIGAQDSFFRLVRSICEARN